jgi:glycosyltransferase involved in cell wall biosynthesis
VIEAVGVVVPVHDEAALLPACLGALDRALARLPVQLRRVAVVVLDACTDDSPAIARAWAVASERAWLRVDVRNVGCARAAGMQRVLDELAAHDRARVWLATTDADSVVPPGWVADQLALAADGAEAVAGSVEVRDWRGYPAGFSERFQQFYAPPGSEDSHGHVHGANLGVRGDAYLSVGGFASLPTGEDHALWNALHARPRVSSRKIAVTTSARRQARAPDGFSRFLARFAPACEPG